METIHVSQLPSDLAAQLLAGIEAFDPTGRLQRHELAQKTAAGACMAATSADGTSQAVYVVRIDNGVAWVDFAKGNGPADWCAILGPVLEAQCKGVKRIAFQTMRPGLVRRAERQGYTVRGWIIAKDLK